ncbi:GYDIA family GHMP kinase [Muriicola sp.]|uniref:GYDIA family GHMP kinase n=1 Tax=Muriicola sp. TaxID=2020856 RepID=UPI003C7621C2
MNLHYHSNGKLLLTGEYAVLDGALALGLPCKMGQGLIIEDQKEGGLLWKSLDHKGKSWFETRFEVLELNGDAHKTSTADIRGTLLNILQGAIQLNPDFLSRLQGQMAISKLEFPRDWGLGSSSTLLNNVAQWAAVDPYQLLWNCFSGSGYDIACAQHNQPLTYQLKDQKPQVHLLPIKLPFSSELFFVHLNRKQNSREGITRYKRVIANQRHFIEEISTITREVAACRDSRVFQELLLQHEVLLSEAIQLTRIQDQLFPDFKGFIKSLGAWGGDFVLAMGASKIPEYFTSKGYSTVLSYDELVL